MKFAILALFGLVAVQAVKLPASNELVERRHRRAEQDEEPVEKKKHGRKQRRADEDEMIEKKKRHGRNQKRVEKDEELAEIVTVIGARAAVMPTEYDPNFVTAAVMPTGYKSDINTKKLQAMATVVRATTKDIKPTTKELPCSKSRWC